MPLCGLLADHFSYIYVDVMPCTYALRLLSYICVFLLPFFLSFSADMPFNRETSLILAEEIASQKENLAIVVRFIEASDDGSDTETRVFADAIVDLWVMIEDSCSIVRQVSVALQMYFIRTITNELVYPYAIVLHF
jgi:hypothetical protein